MDEDELLGFYDAWARAAEDHGHAYNSNDWSVCASAFLPGDRRTLAAWREIVRDEAQRLRAQVDAGPMTPEAVREAVVAAEVGHERTWTVTVSPVGGDPVTFSASVPADQLLSFQEARSLAREQPGYDDDAWQSLQDRIDRDHLAEQWGAMTFDEWLDEVAENDPERYDGKRCPGCGDPIPDQIDTCGDPGCELSVHRTPFVDGPTGTDTTTDRAGVFWRRDAPLIVAEPAVHVTDLGWVDQCPAGMRREHHRRIGDVAVTHVVDRRAVDIRTLVELLAGKPQRVRDQVHAILDLLEAEGVGATETKDGDA